MAEKLVNVRYNYDGTFNKTSYSGGKSIIFNCQDVDEFSYTVALENVKDCLNCTEIGGLYVLNGKPLQWKLLKCDSDLLQLVDACESGGDINIYVDCVVDKECKPLEPGVPFLVVRPRKNILKEHLQIKQNRRTFVSSHQLQQQRQSKRIPRSPQMQEVEQNKLPKSPRLQELAKKNLRSSTHLQEVQNNNLPKTPPKNLRSSTHVQEVQNNNLPKTPPKNLRSSTHLQEVENNNLSKSPRLEDLQKNLSSNPQWKKDVSPNAVSALVAKRRLHLSKLDTIESGRVNEYELRKIQNVEENKKKFKELGLGKYAANPIKPIVQQSTKENKDREDPEYVVENETGDESDDTSEGIKSVQKRKAIPGPRTRSRANDKDLGDKDPVDPIDKGKKVAAASTKSAKLIKPTCSKLLKQGDNSAPSGTIAAYMALRERQKQNLEAEMRREDVGDTDLQNGSEGEEVEEEPKRRRGRSKMLKVHARTAAEKIFVKLSKRGQPIGERKTRSELSNFLGTLVKDHVSLTYVNWHVVPDDLKKKMLEYTLERFDIAPEGEKWVYKTLNSSWRTHKSRVKLMHYSQFDNDEERIQNRPDHIPLEDFKMLLDYWADDGVQILAEDNKARRNMYVETHTLGCKSLAELRTTLSVDNRQFDVTFG
ncbi:uncharacterized protein LOC135150455 [Daucus carota subsp. sativus]|uniref:uncharacterized protein LOC135147240 n=1 Tax=Daucus carota subsp. sativus TaxID=79200 RepID=UPI003082A359